MTPKPLQRYDTERDSLVGKRVDDLELFPPAPVAYWSATRGNDRNFRLPRASRVRRWLRRLLAVIAG